MAPPIEIPEPKLSRIGRALLLGAGGFFALLVCAAKGIPELVVVLLALGVGALCVTQQRAFQADRAQGFARVAWTVFDRTILVLRQTRLAQREEVVVSRRERQVQEKNGAYTTRSSFPVHLVGDGDGFRIWTLSSLSDARATAEQIARALELRLTDLVAEKLSLE